MSWFHKFRLGLCAVLIFLSTVVCTTGYITPGSLAATQSAGAAPPATAFFITPPPTQAPRASPALEELEATETPLVIPTQAPEDRPTVGPPILYRAQSGDTLAALAVRFGVHPNEIASTANISDSLIQVGQLLVIPNVLSQVGPNEALIPDSEVIYSPSSIGFNSQEAAQLWGGRLSTYVEYLADHWHSGGEVIEKIAVENSINPRLLLSILEYESHWLLGEPEDAEQLEYPILRRPGLRNGLYAQMFWAMQQLSIGYYGWREGRLTQLHFDDGSTLRIAPELNAGTVAIQYLFSQLYDYEEWLDVMDPDSGFAATHATLFPDPWVRASQQEPLYPASLTQPELSLPFYGRQTWSFSSGPHGAWDREGSWAALDFAPGSVEPGCVESDQSVTAMAAGLVVRTGAGVVVLDLDGDGNEQTGWVILYLHVASSDSVRFNDWVDRGEILGRPSCEGGFATATHLHIARKYNGEWVSAAGPIPFNLSGWVAQFDGEPYQGTLVRDGETRTACTCSDAQTRIARNSSDPY